ncbi:unnamed protein product, partial [Allacma fusca]
PDGSRILKDVPPTNVTPIPVSTTEENYSELPLPELPTRADDTENDNDSCSSFDSEDDNFTASNEAEKLYPEARISESESAMLILAFVHRHNLSQKAMEDLLELI